MLCESTNKIIGVFFMTKHEVLEKVLQEAAILSQSNLELLREYWLRYKPRESLFNARSGKRISKRAYQCLFDKEVKKAGKTMKTKLKAGNQWCNYIY